VSFLTVSTGRTEIEAVGKQDAEVSMAGDGRMRKISNTDLQMHHPLCVLCK
jgi:hypothetical protein